MSSEEISSSPKPSDVLSSKAQQQQHADPIESTESDRSGVIHGVSQPNPSLSHGDEPTTPKKKDSQTNRCHMCRKKVGLTAVKCRCGYIFCAKHRYTNEHGCTFDYKALAAEELRKNNPQIVAEKVSRI